MTRGGNAGRGRGDGRAGRNGRGGGAGRAGRGTGYNPASKSTTKGLCKELEGHVFDYGAAEKISMTMEKVQQYVGMKLGDGRPVRSPSPRSRFSSNIWFQKELGIPLERARRVEY